MNLHELMGSAVADLPDLPDQLEAVERIHRRRSTAKRATLVAVSTALVLGVGTLTIASPWTHPAAHGVAVGSSPLSKEQFAEDAARILQSSWPVQGASVTWVRQNNDPAATAQYSSFEVEQDSKTWQVRIALFGSSPTTPYPLVTALPSECVMMPADCASDTDGTIHAYDPGAGFPVVYVSSGNDPLYQIATALVSTSETSTPTVVAPSRVLTAPLSSPLTADQLKQLALSDGMRQIYAEAADAGLLVGGVYSTATPIPSTNP